MATNTACQELLCLEDQCLLYLIYHLEEYLPDTLASLPLHLRQRLLLNLPAANICQLQDTAVAASIDVTDTVWKVLEEEQNVQKTYSKNYHWRYTHRAPSSYSDITCGLVFNGFLESARELLFSAQGRHGESNRVGFSKTFTKEEGKDSTSGLLTSKWHSEIYSRDQESQQLKLLSFLIENCKWMPERLTVHCSKMTSSSLWKEREKVKPLMKTFLRKIRSLELVSANDEAVIPFILEHLLSNKRTKLNFLRLADLSSSDIISAAAFFSPGNETNDGQHKDCNAPYNGLSAIEIEGYRLAIDDTLQSVIRYQDNLESVSLSNFYFCETPSVSMVNTLSSLFYQPQFKALTLGGGLSVTWEHLGVLIPAFLAAPSQDTEKALSLQSVVFLDRGAPAKHVAIPGDDKTPLPRKVLTLKFTQRQPSVIVWLAGYDCANLLSSLVVDMGEQYCTGDLRVL